MVTAVMKPDGWMGGWVDGLTDGWMDRWTIIMQVVKAKGVRWQANLLP